MDQVSLVVLKGAEDVSDQEGRDVDSLDFSTFVNNVDPVLSLTFKAHLIDVVGEGIIVVDILAGVIKIGILHEDDVTFCCLNRVDISNPCLVVMISLSLMFLAPCQVCIGVGNLSNDGSSRSEGLNFVN